MAKSKSKGPKIYAVARGRTPGIYGTWNECEAQTKGYSGAIFQSFKTRYEAEAFMRENSSSNSPAASAVAAASTSTSQQGRKRPRDIDSSSSDRQEKRATPQTKSKSGYKSNAQLHIIVHFDGGSRGNPGVAGAGAEVDVVDKTMTNVEVMPGVITSIPPATTSYSIREYCGDRATNNYAEYRGLLVGLKKAKASIQQYASTECAKMIKTAAPLIPLFQLEVYGDSNLIIQQLRGAWQCKNPNILPLYQQSENLLAELRSIDSKSKILFDHVYREQNKVADALANEAMDRRQSWITSTADNTTNDASSNDRKPASGH